MSHLCIEVEALTISFPGSTKPLEVVHGIQFNLKAGEIVGIIGESGSGKTVSMKALLGAPGEALQFSAKKMCFNGEDLLALSPKQWSALRGTAIAYIPQNASDAMTPHHTIRKQLLEAARIHKRHLTEEQMIEKLVEVGISNPSAVLAMRPRQMSGGMSQRVLIAMSTLLNPQLIIADEPTSAIDASLKSMVLELLSEISRKHGTSLMIITHDFEVVKAICSRAYVMYKGNVVEEGDTETLLTTPKHSYTKGLIQCFESLSSPDSTFYSMSSLLEEKPPLGGETHESLV